MSKSGYVTNFQDFAVHDGFGLRVILFLKGCNLNCTWCQNPESISSREELYYHEKLCKDCGKCIPACKQGALTAVKEERVNREKCVKCMDCTKVCPCGALAKVGKHMTSDEVLKVFLDYKPFYDASENGGITISGGDPVCQPEFVSEVLAKCREQGIHTAMETAGYTDYEVLKGIVENLDLLMFDIKHMDSGKHKEGTGVPNERILENIKKLREDFPNLDIIIRLPLIPGYNDDEDNVEKTAGYLSEIGIRSMDLLPFNYLASAKYHALGVKWKHHRVERQEDEYVNRLINIASKYLSDVTIGGMR